MLQELHQRNTVSNRIRILKALFRTVLPSGGSMQEHLHQMTELIDKLHELGTPVEGDVAVSAILASLNEDYDNLVIAMEAWEDNRLTLPNVKAKLMEEWERKRDRQADVALKTRRRGWMQSPATSASSQGI